MVPKIGNVQFIMSFGGVHPTRWWFQLFLYVHKKNGEMIQFDEHIFEMGGGGGTVSELLIICGFHHYFA